MKEDERQVSSSQRLEIGTRPVLLRVMISRSLNLPLSLTVRPREPLSSQCIQTFSMSGCAFLTTGGDAGVSTPSQGDAGDLDDAAPRATARN
ncbi:hypothetical protein BSZ21_15520 [Bradyrhizobium canariense]|nr:hypothetical protein BSZ21_15520 [Bradyrhizobium canariense]